MKTDFYTKTVLTIIAICLTILTFQNVDIIPKTYASKTKDLNLNPLKNYGLVPLNPDGSIDVNIKSASTMDVNIESCSYNAFYRAEPIQVEIKN